MNVDRVKTILTVLDLPSGVVLTITTLTMVGLMIASFVSKRAIDSSIQTVYGIILGAFALHKTVTATTAIVTKQTDTTGS